MNIPEIQTEARQLETTVKNLVADFESRTGTLVNLVAHRFVNGGEISTKATVTIPTTAPITQRELEEAF